MSPIDKQGVVLSSVLWSFDKAFTTMAQQINDGTYGQKGYDLTLANGGISLLKTPHIKPAVWSQIEKAEQGIIDGSITVDKDTKIGAVKAALAPQ
jgi:simple sugar transport system substrate-binding protein